MSNTTDKFRVAFAAIDPYIDAAIISAKETAARGGDYMNWGERNAFPDYLLDLYNRCATLRSVILGCRDFACGNGAELSDGYLQGGGIVNQGGQTIDELLARLFFDYYLTGGCAFQVIRDLAGRIAELWPLDIRYLRTDAEQEVFYYSESWADRRKGEVKEYPAYMADAIHPASVVYIKNAHTQVYPSPVYGSCLKACETEAAIDTFHLNNIKNNFVSSLFVNFNNGDAADEVKEEIERKFAEKFAGAENAGRIGFSWNDNKDSATTFETFSVEDFGARYEALAKHCRQQIFTAFRANPNLFGIPTESLGFSSEEYESAFRLFNRTQIRPVQNVVTAAIGKVLGNLDAVKISPFTLD